MYFLPKLILDEKKKLTKPVQYIILIYNDLFQNFKKKRGVSLERKKEERCSRSDTKIYDHDKYCSVSTSILH